MRLFGSERKPRRRIVKIVFNDKFDIVPVESFLMKTLKLYNGDEYVGSMEYSDVLVDELIENNVNVIDETLDISKLIPKRGRVLGEVEFQQ